MDDEITVVTPESIFISYALAGLGSRFLAHLIDTFIQAALFFSLLAVLVVSGLVTFSSGGSDFFKVKHLWLEFILWAVIILMFFLFFWGYYFFFERVWNGQTPGKRFLRIRVIREGGFPLDFSSALTRNLIRFVDFLPFYYTLGAFSILLSKKCQRLGDMAAGTLVVKEKVPVLEPKKSSPQEIPAVADTSFLPVGRLSEKDFLFLTQFFNRAPSLGKDAKKVLEDKITEEILKKLELPIIPPPFPDSVSFLRAVTQKLSGKYKVL